MKNIIATTILLVLAADIYGQTDGVYNVQTVIDYSKMRPIAMVKYLTEVVDDKWQIDSNYYRADVDRRIICVSKNGYVLKRVFNEEIDVLKCKTPPERNFYESSLQYLSSIGLTKSSEEDHWDQKAEIWDNTKTDILHTLMIMIHTYHNGANQISGYGYDIIIHPN